MLTSLARIKPQRAHELGSTRWRFMGKYDQVGQIASLGNQCVFCILINEDIKGSNSVLGNRAIYRDEHCLIFPDVRQDRCTAHYQCIPKRHIRDYTQLRLHPR